MAAITTERTSRPMPPQLKTRSVLTIIRIRLVSTSVRSWRQLIHPLTMQSNAPRSELTRIGNRPNACLGCFVEIYRIQSASKKRARPLSGLALFSRTAARATVWSLELREVYRRQFQGHDICWRAGFWPERLAVAGKCNLVSACKEKSDRVVMRR